MVNKMSKGLTKAELKEYQGLIEAIDFDDVFGVNDMRRYSLLQSKITEPQDSRIWANLVKVYGSKRVREVLKEKYGE